MCIFVPVRPFTSPSTIPPIPQDVSKAVPRVGGLGVAGFEWRLGGVHPAGVFSDHLQFAFVECRLRGEQDAAVAGWVVRVASEVIAFQAVIFRPTVAIVNEDDICHFESNGNELCVRTESLTSSRSRRNTIG